MNIISKKVRGAIGRLIKVKEKIKVLINLFFLNGKNIFLFGYPIHPNMGDQAQAYCIEKWLKTNYPDYKLFTFNWNTSFPLALKLLRKKIGKNDLIFGHSGYFFFDPHLELPVYRSVAQLFPDYKFVILPQTINITSKVILDQTKTALNGHPNLTLLCRDEVSYEKAQEDFEKCKLLLYPDIVTSLIGSKKFTQKRDGILFCMRNDLETYYKPYEIAGLRNNFIGIVSTEMTDTSITVPYRKIKNNREQILNEMLEKFSQYKLVITDRYHGTIFSLIAATPVIVLSSADHKLSSGAKWFPENFSHYIKYAKDLDEAYTIAIQMLSEHYEYELPPYFQEHYYSRLKEKLQ
jgi:exopolysaccharide biosynthesis predicted pyruvyltransferase EpsI